jgi:hypothetical protein
MTNNRPTGLYSAYLNALIEKHRKEGTPAPAICDGSYWQRWREDHDLHDQSGLNQQEVDRKE